MNKGKYLDLLSNSLHSLPEERIKEIISDIYAHFEDGQSAGLSEEEIATGLGDPEILAQEYLKLYQSGNPQPVYTGEPLGNSFSRREEAYAFDLTFDFNETNSIQCDMASITMVMDSHDQNNVTAHFEGVRTPNSAGKVPYIELAMHSGTLHIKEIHPNYDAGSLLSSLLGAYPRLKGTLTIKVPKKINKLQSTFASGKQIISRITANEIMLGASSGSIEANTLYSNAKIKIKTNSGAQKIKGIQAQDFILNATSGAFRGDAIVAQTISIALNSGSIHLEDAKASGEIHLSATSGSVYLADIHGDSLNLSRNSGRLDAKNIFIQGHTKLQGTSGSTTIEQLRTSQCDIHQHSGQVQLHQIEYGLKGSFESTSGAIKGDHIAGKNLYVKSASGSIHLDAVSADQITCNSASGSIKIKAINACDADMHAASGSVLLELPSDASFSYALDSSSGGIHMGFPTTASNHSRRSAHGTVGDGQHTVKARTASGSIRIEQGPGSHN